jgi:hypothetical protein
MPYVVHVTCNTQKARALSKTYLCTGTIESLLTTNTCSKSAQGLLNYVVYFLAAPLHAT